MQPLFGGPTHPKKSRQPRGVVDPFLAADLPDLPNDQVSPSESELVEMRRDELPVLEAKSDEGDESPSVTHVLLENNS